MMPLKQSSVLPQVAGALSMFRSVMPSLNAEDGTSTLYGDDTERFQFSIGGAF
jgi:hypothetical protein